MSEIGAISGQAIVMDVLTGEIKAMVGNANSQESGLIRAASLLAALETGKVKLSDTVDVGEGVYMVHDRELLDHNWHRGGYGKLTTLQGLMVNSHIANYKNIKRAFTGKVACVCPPRASCADPVGRNSVDPFRRNKNAP